MDKVDMDRLEDLIMVMVTVDLAMFILNLGVIYHQLVDNGVWTTKIVLDEHLVTF